MKNLIVYFSASGVTRRVAESLKEKLSADIFEIKPVNEYTQEDLDWTNDNSRSSIEMKDKSSRPEIKEKLESINDYDTIYIGFPIWWYSAPHIVNTFLESGDFSQKIIIPFCTSGGSELGGSVRDLQKSVPQAEFKEGRRFNFGTSKASVKKWIESLGL